MWISSQDVVFFLFFFFKDQSVQHFHASSAAFSSINTAASVRSAHVRDLSDNTSGNIEGSSGNP